ncbi:hypothetical protein SDC9_36801 [bioreactor metagenome]|uniref:Uncharacterized protein n=1 Tax=bioreactor metagenome TaxID=1076179 RepID=A0A644VHP7_9ZZZZ
MTSTLDVVVSIDGENAFSAPRFCSLMSLTRTSAANEKLPDAIPLAMAPPMLPAPMTAIFKIDVSIAVCLITQR